MPNGVLKEKNEGIIEVFRAHPFVLFWPTLKVIFGFVIVVLIFVFFGASWVFSLAFFVWLFVGGTYFFYYFYIWRKDAYILSEEGVKIKEQAGIFSKQVKEIGLRDITDVTYSVSGFMASLFNFGDVEVQTASSDPLILKKVPHPHKVQKLILEIKAECADEGGKEMTARELIEKLEKESK